MDTRIPTYPTRLPGDLWGLTTYFNPGSYSNKVENLAAFCNGVRRQGLRLLVVELALGDAAFVVPKGVCDRVVRVRSQTTLWHKERLLNLGLAELPDDCDKVAWLDGDILFANDGWVADACALLEKVRVAQLFTTACWLPQGVRSAHTLAANSVGAQTMPGMVHVKKQSPAQAIEHSNYLNDGHTGFAWAARRSLLDGGGFYDAMILGGADLFMAHAFCGNPRVVRGRDWISLQISPPHRKHLVDWAVPLRQKVGGSADCLNGTVLHLWHGDLAKRSYLGRFNILQEEGFDPPQDIAIEDGGCWRWSSDKPNLHRRVQEYFQRREEGATKVESKI